LSIGAVAVGLAPSVFTVLDGSWFLPRVSTIELIEGELDAAAEVGDYRVLYLGDPRLIPYPTVDLGDGVAMAVVGSGRSDLLRRWPVADQATDEQLRQTIDLIATSSTQRGGRLLAAFGVRYVVVPLVDGVTSTSADPLPVPRGLLDSLGGQLDLVRSITASTFARYENTASIPTVAQLQGPLADAAATDSLRALAGVDTSGAGPVLTGAIDGRFATGELTPGVVHFGIALDPAWRLTVGDQGVSGRRSFGVATAYDVAAGGSAGLEYSNPSSRTRWLVVQAVLWALALLAASRLAVPARLRLARARDETLIDLDAEPGAPLPPPSTVHDGFDGWVDELIVEDSEQAAEAEHFGVGPPPAPLVVRTDTDAADSDGGDTGPDDGTDAAGVEPDRDHTSGPFEVPRGTGP